MSVPSIILYQVLVPGQTDNTSILYGLWNCPLPSVGSMSFFTWTSLETKKNNICSSFISRNKYSLRTLTSHDCIHSSGMCTYIVTAMANKPPHNFKRHRLRPSRIPYHSVAIRFNAVMTKAAPENPVIITVILHKISHPIGVPGKSFVCGKNWWTLTRFWNLIIGGQEK